MFGKRKYTPDVLMIGAASFAVAYATEKIMLTPKTEIKISDTVKIPVSGLIPFSQKYVAVIGREALNKMLPLSAQGVSGTLKFLKAKDRVKEAAIWFVYDFLGRYSLNTLLSGILKKFNIFDKDSYKNVLKDFVQRIISQKSDRDDIIRGITAEIVSLLRLLSDGTILAMFLNDKFVEVASATIENAVDRFLSNDAAERIADFFMTFVGQLEDITIPNLFINILGVDRAKMAQVIDNVYDTFFGDSMVQMFKDLKLGDVVYELLSDVNYDELYKYISMYMQTDLLRVCATSAVSSMYFFSGAKAVVFKAKKRAEKKQDRQERKKIRQEMRDLLKNENA